MPCRGRCFAEHYYGGGHQGIGELPVRGAKTVNMQQGHVLGEITAQGDAVIHVHEFRGDKPNGKALLFHPVVAEQQKVAVQPSQAADFEMQRPHELHSQAVLFRRWQMMMAHVRRIGEHEIERLRRSALPREVSLDNREPLLFPQGSSGLRK